MMLYTIPFLLTFVWTGSGFYLPGVAPREYRTGEEVSIKVNSIKSTKTAIPYDYYSLFFCRPDSVKMEPESLGEILWGDNIKPSRYATQMLTDIPCKKICTTTPKDDKKHQIRKLKMRIDQEYRGHLILDNLPVAEVFIWEHGSSTRDSLYYRRGFPLGVPANGSQPSLVNNHLHFTVKYHKPTAQSPGQEIQGYRIVGFNVFPYSVESNYIAEHCTGSEWEPWKHPPQPLFVGEGNRAYGGPVTQSVTWSYSVKWEEDPNVAWSSRWDHYLHSADSADAKIHWFSITNSLLVVLFLSAMVATIMLRSLHKDFNRYNNPENEYESQEETGWKLVHGDVFREPSNPRWLAVYVGTGSQLFGMANVTILFACLGFLSPANRGSLMTAMLILFVLMGCVGGYVTSRIARMFHEVSWFTVGQTAMFVPGTVFGVFFFLNIVMHVKQAANAVPFVTFFGLIALWFCVSVPLVFLGGLFGYKQPTITHPLRVNNIPRHIPQQPWFLQWWIVIPAAGLVPFMAAFIEISFIVNSLWMNKFYYVFGFFAIVFFILVVTCIETAIVGTYFQLCFEDYNWWWRSFLLSASCGGWLLVYCVYYFFTTLKLATFWGVGLYFAYMSLASYCFGIMTGSVGFWGVFIFVRIIYSVLKVD